MATPPTPDLVPHGSRATANRLIAFGAITVIGSTILVFGAGAVGVVVPVLAAAVLIGLGVYLRAAGPQVQAVNTAVSHIGRGRLAEASALLEWVEAAPYSPYIVRAAAISRATIALRRGNLQEAIAHASRAVDAKTGLLGHQPQAVQIELARGMRAYLRASTGDAKGARDDIATVEASENASPEALAQTAMAEGLLAQTAGDDDRLATLLATKRRLLLEHTHPRDRAIVRAFQRMLKAKSRASSVYRASAPKDEDREGEEASLADWAAKIAPAAAPFMLRPQASAGADMSPSVLGDPAAAPAARKAAEERNRVPGFRQNFAKVGLLWVLLIAMFIGIWQFLAPDRSSTRPHASPMPPPMVLPEADASAFVWVFTLVGTLLLLGVALAFVVVQQKRATRRFLAGGIALSRDDEAGARAVWESFTKGHGPWAAQAHAALAPLAVRRGDFDAAVAHCDRGLAELHTEQLRAAHSDLLVPALLGERAYAYAALGRTDTAVAELDHLAERHPGYGFLDAVRFRVGLVARAHAGDFEGAARSAIGSADLAIGPRDELLADLVRAVANPIPVAAGEVERVDEELRAEPVVAAWIEAVAPGLIAAFEQSRAHAEDVADTGEHEAERERLAEEEALATDTAVVRTRA